LRAGRFDRQVVVDRPDVHGREDILRVHAKRVRLAVDVDLALVARRTPGMVGADLANVVNEAALASVRRGSEIAGAQDFDEAIDRIQLGLKKEGKLLSDDEKRRVAAHEAGHAVVAMSLDHTDPVHRVTIIPRSVGALGATLQLPAEERHLMTRGELSDRICVLLGGRAAEEIACDDVSTGAEDDLVHATDLARHMVCRFGMSDALGAVALGDESPPRIGAWSGEPLGHGLSEESRRAIDHEVTAMVEREHARARETLTRRRPALDAIAKELVARETLQRAELEALARDAEAGPALRAVS
jgi:cell division protease FtsH